ncbi:relaxase/mobilization nuclease domain-containing protein, partial [Methylobacterium hispanicum]
MISGAMRGKGGRALSAHLLKAENEQVVVIGPRGLGSPDLHGQLGELVALSLGGRTDAPCYHVHVDPEIGISDNVAARAMWWRLFEAEFGLGQQPYCGAEHVKHGRAHEHRVYSLVRRDGSVVDVGFDFIRREKVSRRVEHAFGLEPVPSKHARGIERALRGEGHVAVADWLVASGSLDAER